MQALGPHPWTHRLESDFFFSPHCKACGILVFQTRIEPRALQWECQGPTKSLGTTRGFPRTCCITRSLGDWNGESTGWIGTPHRCEVLSASGRCSHEGNGRPPPAPHRSSSQWSVSALIRCVCVLVAQSCPTLGDPMDCSSPGSSVHRIFQVRVLEWVPISYSRGSSWPRDGTRISCIADRFLIIWDTREDLIRYINAMKKFTLWEFKEVPLSATYWDNSYLWV